RINFGEIGSWYISLGRCSIANKLPLHKRASSSGSGRKTRGTIPHQADLAAEWWHRKMLGLALQRCSRHYSACFCHGRISEDGMSMREHPDILSTKSAPNACDGVTKTSATGSELILV